jgi:hypothetical protein
MKDEKRHKNNSFKSLHKNGVVMVLIMNINKYRNYLITSIVKYVKNHQFDLLSMIFNLFQLKKQTEFQ